jgi:hypothetical protein
MLVELQGSDKQIAWALRIRVDKLNKWKKSDPNTFEEIESQLVKESKASYWIAHKDDDLGGILKYLQGAGTVKSVSSASSLSPTTVDRSEYKLASDGLYKYVGELRDTATGAVVVDPDCPF